VKNVYITAAKRSAIGGFLGQFNHLSSPQIAAQVIKAVADDVGHPDEVVMGCVLQAGLGQSPARQAALLAALPNSIPCSTVNKVCGSGLKSIMMAHDQIKSGMNQHVLAGGMESMTNAPFALERARQGFKFGHQEVLDLMNRDGLEDAYHKNAKGGRMLMGDFAEKTVEKYGFTRGDQESFAKITNERTHANLSIIQNEIVPVIIKDAKGQEIIISTDEPYQKVKSEKFSYLKPAFKADGTITAATSSSLADGAAIVAVSSEDYIAHHNLMPLAKIVGYAQHAHEPEWFTTAPISAIDKVLKKCGWGMNDVDLFEINEAFAVVPMAAMVDLNIPHEKVNVFGGACSWGHPIGASGTRIVVTLINALKSLGKKRGVAAICIGSGEGIAMAIEVI
jgi:acetyl-CoA C-acetyltransferase